MRRRPVMAGQFYEADPSRLRSSIQTMLRMVDMSADRSLAVGGQVAGLIVPHAGYVYSGQVAAHGYAALSAQRGVVHRIILAGTSHTRADGILASSAETFGCPLGDFPVDQEQIGQILGCKGVLVDDWAHAQDHALEVQLPFLAVAVGLLPIVPLLVGQREATRFAHVLERIWQPPETCLVISSDLSHGWNQQETEQFNASTARLIEHLAVEAIPPERACGHAAITGALRVARQRGYQAWTLCLDHSGHHSRRRSEAVGYGAFLIIGSESKPSHLQGDVHDTPALGYQDSRR